MQFLTFLTFLLTASFELGSAHVVPQQSYRYDVLQSPFRHLETPRSLKDIRRLLKKSHIIGDVFDVFTPTCYITPFFKYTSVIFGNEIDPKHTQEPPSIQIFCPGKWDVEGGLTVIMTDPDVPGEDNDDEEEKEEGEGGKQQMCHWIAKVPAVVMDREGIFTNVDSRDFVSVVEWYPPSPPKGSGIHRYVFAVVEGDNWNIEAPKERKNWGVGSSGAGPREWIVEEGLGPLVGANYYVVPEAWGKGKAQETREREFEM